MHILPTDPAFRDLNAVQTLWIWQNMAKDLEEVNQMTEKQVGSMSVIQSDPDIIKQKIAEFKARQENK